MIPFVYLVLGFWSLFGPVWNGLAGLAQLALVIAVIAVLWFLGRRRRGELGSEPLTRAEWGRIAAIFIMGCFVVFFWMGFEQAGGTMSLFADQQTDRMLSAGRSPRRTSRRSTRSRSSRSGR